MLSKKEGELKNTPKVEHTQMWTEGGDLEEEILPSEMGYICGAAALDNIIHQSVQLMYHEYLDYKLNAYTIMNSLSNISEIIQMPFMHMDIGESLHQVAEDWGQSEPPKPPPLDSWIRGSVKWTSAEEIYDSIKGILSFSSFEKAAKTFGGRIRKNVLATIGGHLLTRPMAATSMRPGNVRPGTAMSIASLGASRMSATPGLKGTPNKTNKPRSTIRAMRVIPIGTQKPKKPSKSLDKDIPKIMVDDMEYVPSISTIPDFRPKYKKTTQVEEEEETRQRQILKIEAAKRETMEENQLAKKQEEDRLKKACAKHMYDFDKKDFTRGYEGELISVQRMDQKKFPKPSQMSIGDTGTQDMEHSWRDSYKHTFLATNIQSQAIVAGELLLNKFKNPRLYDSQPNLSTGEFNQDLPPSKALNLEYGVTLIEKGEEYHGENKAKDLLSPKAYRDRLQLQDEREAEELDKENRIKALKAKREAKLKARELKLIGDGPIAIKPGGLRLISTYGRDVNLKVSKSRTHHSALSPLLPSKDKIKLPTLKTPHLIDKIYDYKKPSEEDDERVPGSVVARFNKKFRLQKEPSITKSKEELAHEAKMQQYKRDKKVKKLGKDQLSIIAEGEDNKRVQIAGKGNVISQRIWFSGKKNTTQNMRLPPPPLGKTMGHGFSAHHLTYKK